LADRITQFFVKEIRGALAGRTFVEAQQKNKPQYGTCAQKDQW
jgi:hypothetical protein